MALVLINRLSINWIKFAHILSQSTLFYRVYVNNVDISYHWHSLDFMIIWIVFRLGFFNSCVNIYLFVVFNTKLARLLLEIS